MQAPYCIVRPKNLIAHHNRHSIGQAILLFRSFFILPTPRRRRISLRTGCFQYSGISAVCPILRRIVCRCTQRLQSDMQSLFRLFRICGRILYVCRFYALSNLLNTDAVYPQHQLSFQDVVFGSEAFDVLNDCITVFRIGEIRAVQNSALCGFAVYLLCRD